jgi:hypothetical protein
LSIVFWSVYDFGVDFDGFLALLEKITAWTLSANFGGLIESNGGVLAFVVSNVVGIVQNSVGD